MEKTPSVTISWKRASRASSRRRARSPCRCSRSGALRALAEPDAVDDRGVVQLVGDHGVLLVEQRLEETPVGVEAGRVQDRVLGAEELGDRRLEAVCESSACRR